jgi:hypothetical protein
LVRLQLLGRLFDRGEHASGVLEASCYGSIIRPASQLLDFARRLPCSGSPRDLPIQRRTIIPVHLFLRNRSSLFPSAKYRSPGGWFNPVSRNLYSAEPLFLIPIGLGSAERNPQPSTHCLLSDLLVHEQYFGIGLRTSNRSGRIAGPVSNRFRCKRILQLCQNRQVESKSACIAVRRSICPMGTR